MTATFATCLASQDGDVDAAGISKDYIRTLEGHRPFTTSQHGYFETSKELSSTIYTDLHTGILKLITLHYIYELESSVLP
jgi:hypothetical protein